MTSPNNLDYETVAAAQTDQALGPVGKTGDILDRLIIVPASVSPGAVSIKDGGGSAIVVFPGGTNSLTELKPFVVELRLRSRAGAWSVTTGSNVSAIAAGKFS